MIAKIDADQSVESLIPTYKVDEKKHSRHFLKEIDEDLRDNPIPSKR